MAKPRASNFKVTLINSRVLHVRKVYMQTSQCTSWNMQRARVIKIGRFPLAASFINLIDNRVIAIRLESLQVEIPLLQ